MWIKKQEETEEIAASGYRQIKSLMQTDKGLNVIEQCAGEARNVSLTFQVQILKELRGIKALLEVHQEPHACGETGKIKDQLTGEITKDLAESVNRVIDSVLSEGEKEKRGGAGAAVGRRVERVNEEKMRLILDAMQGITYLEWNKLSHVIDREFSSRASHQANNLEMASPDEIVSRYKWLL